MEIWKSELFKCFFIDLKTYICVLIISTRLAEEIFQKDANQLVLLLYKLRLTIGDRPDKEAFLEKTVLEHIFFRELLENSNEEFVIWIQSKRNEFQGQCRIREELNIILTYRL